MPVLGELTKTKSFFEQDLEEQLRQAQVVDPEFSQLPVERQLGLLKQRQLQITKKQDSFGQAVERSVLSSDVGRAFVSGVQQGAATLDRRAANVLDLLGADGTAEDFRRRAAELSGRSTGNTPQEGFLDAPGQNAARVAGAALVEIPQFVGGTRLFSALGAGAAAVPLATGTVGATSKLDEGVGATAERFAKDATVGALFPATATMKAVTRAGLVGAGGFALADGDITTKEGVQQRLVQGAALGAFALLPAGQGGKSARARRAAERPAPRATKSQTERVLRATSDDALRAQGKAGNVNLDRISGPKDVINVIDDIAKEHQGFPASRVLGTSQATTAAQGDEILALANRLGVPVDDLLKNFRVAGFSSAKIAAARQVLTDSADEVAALARVVRETSDDRAMAALQHRIARHATIQEEVTGITAEAGRALSFFNRQVQGKQASAAAIDQIIKKGGGKQTAKALADAITSFETPDQLAAFAKQAIGATTKEKMAFAWINGLLSGPKTHVVNTTSNAAFNVLASVEELAAAGLDSFRRGPDKVSFREAFATLSAYGPGVRDGIKAFSESLRTGKRGIAVGKLDIARVPFQSKIGQKVARFLPTGLLSAEDEFFKAISYRQSLHRAAIRDGISRGLTKGRDLRANSRRFISNPPKEARAAAEQSALTLTFQQPLQSKVMKAVQQAQQHHLAVKALVPFVTTPTNIFKESLKRGPLAFAVRDVREAIKAGGAERTRALARIGVGSGIAAWTAGMTLDGKITGSIPRDPGARAVFYQTGRKPYSIKLGDEWVSFARMEPFAQMMGVASDAAQIMEHLDEKEQGEVAAAITYSISKNLTSKTFLAGLGALVQALEDPERFGARLPSNLVGSLIPTGVAQFNQSEDPYLKDAREILDRTMIRLGMDDQIAHRRDLFGEKIKVQEGSRAERFLSPFSRSAPPQDMVAEKLFDLKLEVEPLKRSIRIGRETVKLTPQEFEQRTKEVGRITKVALDRVMKTDAYLGLTDEGKALLFKEVIRRVRREMVPLTTARVQARRERENATN